MDPDQNQPQIPAKREPSLIGIKPGAEVQAAAGYLPQSGIIRPQDRKPLAQEEGYDPLAIELALEPSEASFMDKLRLTILTLVAAALVLFFFPAERFFKPATQELGPLTIGGPTNEANSTQIDNRNQPWFKVLLEIDRLYFGEGKLSQAIRVAESALEIVPKKNWESWKKVHYRYWELLWAAGRIHSLKAASRAYLLILPEDPFANYYYTRAFLSATNRVQSFTPEMKQTYRQEAESLIQQLDNACNALNAQRKHPDAKDKDILTELYQKLHLKKAELFVLIWKLGGYKEDKHPDVVLRDQALNICDSAELTDMKEAKELKINIYTHILDRWYWFEGQQVIQGTKLRRKELEQELAALREALRKVKQP
jgi:hypothetical protein